MTVAAVDQGTTSTRSMILDRGALRIVAARRHRTAYPRPGWVEQNGEELLADIQTCLAACGPVDAFGIDNQGESCLAWDSRTGRPLSPVIVWQDNRTHETTRRLAAEGAEAVVRERSGLPLDPYFSASKLAWLLAENDDVRAARRNGTLRLGTTDSFFVERLTGRYVTDVTTASRTSLMNISSCRWDEELCSLFGVPIELLPEIVPTVGPIGEYGDALLSCSVVDQQAALFGHGCRSRGDMKITFGTGAFALVLTGSEPYSPPPAGLLPTVAWQIGNTIQRALDGGLYDAGSVIEWLLRMNLLHDMAELAVFERPTAIERGLIFVPALSGLACPHWDRSAAALWIGMSPGTGRLDLCRAALEGIALATADLVDAIDGAIPLDGAVSVDGGLTRSAYFCQFLADAIARPVAASSEDELTAKGTLELAALGCNAEIVLPRNRTTLYQPGNSLGSAFRARFAEAIGRSRSWTGTGNHAATHGVTTGV